MRGLLFVFRLVLILFVVRLVVRFFARAFAASRVRRPPAAAPPRPLEELVRDRVCNTYLPRAKALLGVVEGREEHFCSAACRDKALLAASRAS
jgi:hypothetical protein